MEITDEPVSAVWPGAQGEWTEQGTLIAVVLRGDLTSRLRLHVEEEMAKVLPPIIPGELSITVVEADFDDSGNVIKRGTLFLLAKDMWASDPFELRTGIDVALNAANNAYVAGLLADEEHMNEWLKNLRFGKPEA